MLTNVSVLKDEIVSRELPCYDGRQSFYGKAEVIESKDKAVLVSYGERICIYDRNNDSLTLCFDPACTSTTLRHFRSFLWEIGWWNDISKAGANAFDLDTVYTHHDYLEVINSKKAYRK